MCGYCALWFIFSAQARSEMSKNCQEFRGGLHANHLGVNGLTCNRKSHKKIQCHNIGISPKTICGRFQKEKTCTVFLSSLKNTSGSLGEREMLWEHEPQASVSTAFSSSLKLSRVFLLLDRNMENMFSISFRKHRD